MQKDKGEKEIQVTSSIGDFDAYMDLSLYSKMPEASKPVSSVSEITVLEAVFEIVRDFVFTPNASKKSTTSRFKLIKEKFLPDNNAMPKSFEDAIKVIEPLLVTLHKFNVCPNDCVIFRKHYSDMSSCPICGESRFKKRMGKQQEGILHTSQLFPEYGVCLPLPIYTIY